MSGHSKWANIKHRKGKMDSQRGKVFTKIGKEIMVAVKMGGADPSGNMRLKLALQKAKANNLPNDNVQRSIQKGLGSLDGANYEEILYEGYGPGGVAVLLEIMTDNRNRTAGEIRHLFSKHGGNLGEAGCVAWMFEKKAIFEVEKTKEMNEDIIMEIALEAGAEDFKVEGESVEITAQPEDFEAIQQMLLSKSLSFTNAEITMLPKTTVCLDGEDATKMLKLMEILEEHEDVQELYTNFDIDEETMENF